MKRASDDEKKRQRIRGDDSGGRVGEPDKGESQSESRHSIPAVSYYAQSSQNEQREERAGEKFGEIAAVVNDYEMVWIYGIENGSGYRLRNRKPLAR